MMEVIRGGLMVSNPGVHFSHCNQGEESGHCKYGDEDCPAVELTKELNESILKVDEAYSKALKHLYKMREETVQRYYKEHFKEDS